MFSRKKEPKNALGIPPDALTDPNAGELMRAWIVHGSLHVSLQPRALGDDPSMWGILLVDVARHIARAFQSELNLPPDETLKRIRSMFDAEWDAPTDLGTTEKHREH